MTSADNIPFEQKRFEMDDGVTLIADCYGDEQSPPLLLSHGGGQTRHAWGKTARELASRGWHTIAYDHRGHGESGWSSCGNYTLDRFAHDQLTLAKQLSQAPVLVGASLGGLSAMLAHGEFHQDLYSAVILVDITPQMNQQGALEIMKFMSNNLEQGFASLEEAAKAVALYTQRDRQANPKGLKKNLRLCEDGRYRWHWDPAFLSMQQDAGGSPERLIRATQQIKAPLLLVRGRQSDLVTEAVAEEFLSLVPDADFVDVAQARHMVAGDRNDVFNDAIIRFLQEKVRPDTAI